ncbi:14819_t:CDS:2 [Dentiscutata heterogama]|uniref:14819_t:CDS:1 n=1 Tax=Dentiscutata heterogama TaxID=1316150 RepID=A0ACA9MDE7_9GLOM|nr:14819_t:CDS:2 [Dentiscutata heterogama]
MTLNLENFLLKDIKNLFNDQNYSNVVIQVGRHPDTNNFKAHSLILRARSSYFRSALKANDGQVSTLNLPDISPRVFEHILNGTINLNYTSLRSIYFEILIASSDLKLTELIDHLQTHLLTNDAEWIHANLLKLLYLTFTHPSYSRLSKFCQNIFNTQSTQIFSSSEFLNLEEQFLINIIERSDLQIDEIVIWEAVIRWGIGKLPSLSEDAKEWTNKDFIKLRKVVKNLLPHIRFFNISGLDHRTKIRPFKKILGKELREEIKDFFFAKIPPTKFQQLPPRIIGDSSNENKNHVNNQVANNLYANQANSVGVNTSLSSINSIIIGEKGFSKIASWIDKKQPAYTYTPAEIPYDFRLLYRGSRDGVANVKKFHERCGNQGATVIIIKIAESTRVLGGYNPEDWLNENAWGERMFSFIFSMENDHDEKDVDNNYHKMETGNSSNDNETNNAIDSPKSKKDNHDIVARVKLAKFAIWNSQKNPGFSLDLRWFSGTCTPKAYDKPIFDDKVFSLTDFEVFKVEKKCANDAHTRKRARITRVEDEEEELDFDLDEGDYGGDNAEKRLKL